MKVSVNELVVKNNAPVGKRSKFDEYNMHEDIKKWRYEGNSFKKIVNLIKEKFGVDTSYTALYTYCVKKGLTGDMSGEREKTINGHQELLDSLTVVKKNIALNYAMLEEFEKDFQSGDNKDINTKLYVSIVTSNERLLARRESLVKTITQTQALVYKYSLISDCMDRFKDMVKDEFGLDVWNRFRLKIINDVCMRELLKQIPKENDVVPIKKNCPKNEGKTMQRLGVSL